MQCNIDARGRAVRRNVGMLCCVIATASVGLGLWGVYGTVLLSVGIILILAGLFQFFQARKGWCAIRAMGIRTPV
jgi:hypothetical protein